MYVHMEAKAVWLCHPRTASRATAALLREYGFKGVCRDDITHKPAIPVSRLPFKTVDAPGHHTRLAEKPEGWKVGCTVRHHFEVITSWLFSLKFHHARNAGKLQEAIDDLDIVEFIQRLHSRSIGGIFYPKKGELMPNLEFATFIAHYHFLQSDMRVWLLECFGQSPLKLEIPLKGEKPRGGTPVDDVLTDAMKAAIIDAYEGEMREWSFLVDDAPVGYL